ncbi:MAG TPA: hypothetical protein PKC96_07935 [Bacilli bacterium]|nr:hypothetical protein [Bacilli bacterium]
MIVSFLISLAIVIGINAVVTIIMGLVGAPLYIVLIASSLAIAFFFAMINFRHAPGGRLKNPAFHRYFVTNFIFLLVINYIFNFLI